MRTPQERMKEDPVFAALVHSFFDMFARHCGSGAGITPSEVREASGLAWQMYIERHPEPIPWIKGSL
jgi:hypothetical protein